MEDGVTEHYKTLQLEFVSNLNGSTKFDTLIHIVPVFFPVFILGAATPDYLINSSRNVYAAILYFIEFFCQVVPCILWSTVFSDIIGYVLIFFLMSSFFVLWARCGSEYTDLKHSITKVLESRIPSNRNLITVFRSTINVGTAVCILAVDFKVFPRRFAKTESFGCSVMDAGVGLYCVANALVSPDAIKLNAPRTSLHKEIMGCVPLTLLGCLRFFMIQQSDYQVNVLEYGVHWNFFLTLASLKLVCSLIMSLFKQLDPLKMAIAVIMFHQCVLQTGIQDWVLSGAARTDFLSANREGIVSTMGYVAIYLIGISVGRDLQQHSTLFSDQIKLLRKICVKAIIIWFLSVPAEMLFGVSRRLANIGYLLWILFCSYIMLGSLLLPLLAVHLIKFAVHRKDKSYSISYGVPKILEAINYNGLAFFLIANLLTGLVNICIPTLEVSTVNSLLILHLYMFVTCATTFFLYWKKIKLKFW